MFLVDGSSHVRTEYFERADSPASECAMADEKGATPQNERPK
jgi:hypothetical protein